MSDLERDVLLFEAEHPGKANAGAKAREIRARFKFSAARYVQAMFHGLLDPEAEALVPAVYERHRAATDRARRLRDAVMQSTPSRVNEFDEVHFA